VKKILIVDDSLAEVKLMQSVLEKADVVMPERNGFQACRELKGNAATRAIPVVIVSSKNTDSDKFWAQQQGADGYVIKPFTPAELLGAVQRFV